LIARDRRRRALLDDLERRVVDLTGSEAWTRYLTIQARFHRYSPRNVLLISMQRPEASHVAGFRAWSSLGRHVRRGERAINILAPMITKDAASGDPRIVGFRWVSVFDLSQTDGEDLPSPVSLLDGSDPRGIEEALRLVARVRGLDVVDGDLPAGVNGELRWAQQRIVLRGSNSPPQRAKTLAHELAHSILHRHEADRARAEIEAEATAFVVLGFLGVDTAPYSAGYLASWIGEGGDVRQRIATSCDQIQLAAREIIDDLETTAALRAPLLSETPDPVALSDLMPDATLSERITRQE
jgi:hypothetical protein